jgi:methylphosphotriester-DNA--protein-cysteine methyltransferase
MPARRLLPKVVLRPRVRHLNRMFHDQFGATPAEYVESVRLEAAQALLADGATVTDAPNAADADSLTLDR